MENMTTLLTISLLALVVGHCAYVHMVKIASASVYASSSADYVARGVMTHNAFVTQYRTEMVSCLTGRIGKTAHTRRLFLFILNMIRLLSSFGKSFYALCNFIFVFDRIKIKTISVDKIYIE